MKQGWYALWHWWRDLSGVHRATFLLEILGVLVVAAYTTVAALQWDQMKAATKATKRSADAAKSAADSAWASLKQSADEFEIDERPYLVGEYVRLGGSPMPGQKLAGEVLWRNTGRTPALQVHMYLRIDVLDKEPAHPEDWIELAKKQSANLAIRSSLARSLPVVSDNPLSDLWFNRITSRTYHVYVFGAIVYTSIFGRLYDSCICARYDSGSVNELYLFACQGKGTNDVK